MRKGFGISILTEPTTKEKYTHQRLLQLYLTDLLAGRKYLHDHIGYFISHARWNVGEKDYHMIASDAITLIDQQIMKQIKKYPDGIDAVKMGRYLIMRLRGYLMNTHLASVKEYTSPYDEEHQNLSCEIGYDDFDDSLSLIGLSDVEQKVVSMKIKGFGEREIMSECNLNRSSIRHHYTTGLKKVKEFYLSQGIGHEISTEAPCRELQDKED